jgi:hypothetical protein
MDLCFHFGTYELYSISNYYNNNQQYKHLHEYFVEKYDKYFKHIKHNEINNNVLWKNGIPTHAVKYKDKNGKTFYTPYNNCILDFIMENKLNYEVVLITNNEILRQCKAPYFRTPMRSGNNESYLLSFHKDSINSLKLINISYDSIKDEIFNLFRQYFIVNVIPVEVSKIYNSNSINKLIVYNRIIDYFILLESKSFGFTKQIKEYADDAYVSEFNEY